jgi:ribosomal protein L37AE/L43A
VRCAGCRREEVLPRRAALGYVTCMPCGEREARGYKHTIVPMHKSGYIVVSKESRELLTQLNRPGRGSNH